MIRIPWLAAALAQALAVLVPVSCAGCGARDAAVCARCRAAIRPRVVRVADAEAVVGVPVVAALAYGGVAARLLGGLKERGRTDAAPVLAPALRASVLAAVEVARATGPPGSLAMLVPMPSSVVARRRRGFRIVELLLRRAGCRAVGRPVLRLERTVADQAGLGVDARRANLAGAMRASGAVRGRVVVLVDDVVTTGATLREARRAVRAAGGSVRAAACLARTEKRFAHTAKQKGSVR